MARDLIPDAILTPARVGDDQHHFEEQRDRQIRAGVREWGVGSAAAGKKSWTLQIRMVVYFE